MWRAALSILPMRFTGVECSPIPKEPHAVDIWLANSQSPAENARIAGFGGVPWLASSRIQYDFFGLVFLAALLRILRNQAEQGRIGCLYNQTKAVSDRIGELEWSTFEYSLSTEVGSGDC